MTNNMFLLLGLVIAAILTVTARTLAKVAVGFAFTSVISAVLMFHLSSPLAGVFELSVCGGLITVVFVAAVSLASPQGELETLEQLNERKWRYVFLPVLVIFLGMILFGLGIKPPVSLPLPDLQSDVRTVLWNRKFIDIAGQVLLILTGVIGVVLLLKERKSNEF
jgi:NADH-quinone oxidoreductase subunit J